MACPCTCTHVAHAHMQACSHAKLHHVHACDLFKLCSSAFLPHLSSRHCLCAIRFLFDVTCPFDAVPVGPLIETADNPDRIRDLALYRLVCQGRPHVTSVAFAIWHSLLTQSASIYFTVPTRKQIPYHEMDAWCRQRCRRLRLDMQPIAHRRSEHGTCGTQHAARAHSLFLSFSRGVSGANRSLLDR